MILDRLPQKRTNYFEAELNYSLANEDTALEMGMLADGLDRIVVVAGSGSRAVPLLAKRPRSIVFTDVSAVQLALTELRYQTTRELPYSDYIRFWGYPGGLNASMMLAGERRECYEALDLSSSSRTALRDFFISTNYAPLLYEGRWERSFQKLAKVAQKILGANAIEDFFEREISLPSKRWKLVLALVGNSRVFNALLYRGAFPQKNIPESFLQFYDQAFERIFQQGSPKQNFFLQLCLLGKIRYHVGLPVEANQKIFEAAKNGALKAQVQFRQGSVFDVMRQETNISALSLSDVPSYLSGRIERTFLQDVLPSMQVGGKVICRYYLRVPKLMDMTGFTDITHHYASLIQAEKVQMYRVQVLERMGMQSPIREGTA